MKLNLKILLCLLASCMYCISGCQALPDSSDSLDSLDFLEQSETFVTFKALPLPDLFVDVPD
ncbi:MAG: hypothetical protein K2O42_08245, partial [Oscillospiraceae bacterium]|nr:hypothetical protein [Oscillospiraceae bacterium]